jgi:hypothetical protein
LPRTNWKAVLSDTSQSARGRLTITGAVYNLQDDLIAVSHSNFFSTGHAGLIQYREDLSAIPFGLKVWTGSRQSVSVGSSSGSDCQKWSITATNAVFGTIGNPADKLKWLEQTTQSCADVQKQAALYCISQ